MSNGDVTRDTFEKMDTDSKLNVLFDLHDGTRRAIKVLEGRKIFFSTLSLFGGMAGGILAVMGKGFLKG